MTVLQTYYVLIKLAKVAVIQILLAYYLALIFCGRSKIITMKNAPH